ncbi:PD-(D/E)XK nuclease-like domain-containing protein [Weissella cibaria]|mgnify:CR=1 FL=1|uniref:PD-(D/E)XK nuclease-like domain-containing protein n=1 Tax=Weissella cibaria TaxID=137591 RepID=UPI0022E54FEB|nr:PD-(D/E)XK nuclease-like domain-containing protein [Weissella cibaria]
MSSQSTKMPQVTERNYYDPELGNKMMSASLFKSFLSNEASALAAMRGEYDLFENKTALYVGNYLHSYFESAEAHEIFIAEHFNDIYKTSVVKTEPTEGRYKTHRELQPITTYQKYKADGTLAKPQKTKPAAGKFETIVEEQLVETYTKATGMFAEFERAQLMIDRIEQDKSLMAIINAATEHEVILTGEIDGVPWKGKADALNLEMGYLIDYKTVRTLVADGSEWNDEAGRKQNFIKNRRYDVQMAAYKELLKQKYNRDFDIYIIAVSKENGPLADLYQLTNETLAEGMQTILNYQHRFMDIIHGKLEPTMNPDHSRYFNERYRVDLEQPKTI